jgi:hypothetical protein
MVSASAAGMRAVQPHQGVARRCRHTAERRRQAGGRRRGKNTLKPAWAARADSDSDRDRVKRAVALVMYAPHARARSIRIIRAAAVQQQTPPEYSRTRVVKKGGARNATAADALGTKP